MVKRCANLAIVYAVFALVFGVFYREFTKYNHFTEGTTLSLIHPHYLVLGTGFFLMLMLMEKSFGVSRQKHVRALMAVYQLGLNITILGLLLRGLTQVLGTELSAGMDASLSGVAGIGHTMLGVTLVWLLFAIKKQAVSESKT